MLKVRVRTFLGLVLTFVEVARKKLVGGPFCPTILNMVNMEKDCVIGVNIMIISTKHYVTVVTLSINDSVKFSENIKQGFKRTISWKKYAFELTTQTKKQ